MAWFGRGRGEAKGLSRLAQAGGPVGAYAAAGLPDPATPAAHLRLLALDVETTGLDPAKDHILSVGFVPVSGRAITLDGAGQVHVRPPDGHEGVGASATVHGLTDDQVAEGVSAREALDLVAAALTGRVLLAHHAPIEVGFLSAVCRAAYGCDLPVRVIDTLALAQRAYPAHVEPPPGALRLWSARARFGLPVYGAHDALMDALACGELYLAQLAELEATSSRPVTLARLASSP
ncbi:3'-5' exonuclease [Nostocoides australiense]|uniref:DNA polymerase III epsilon subunit n=1 Tax=Nostocoides australiense Ben110 TaxID=1193182 RepID=W6JUH0_9MICO|nr:exonuclease domain-containing protein [Tetrasphaera australiensis]MCA0290730.1 DNA polymerase III subunit epsilon [Actinomycetota bacterium]CCH73033.1 DNA polymerase III epsilon subunit [Tetrasphaera australiensis Ben110]HPF80909.1 exonuclease domain-containing protein [Tetrasphaera australiensis]HRW01819.1 exonuclease domain-containing protein [Tetrasphaera sp.]